MALKILDIYKKCVLIAHSANSRGIVSNDTYVKDPDRLHYCRNFYEKKSGRPAKDTTEILGFMNKIMNKIAEESENKI